MPDLPPPVPVGSLPRPNHPLWFGYMLDNSPYSYGPEYGWFRPEIQDTVNMLLCWSYYWGEDRAGFIADMRDAAASGKPFMFGPNVSPADTTLTDKAIASLNDAAPYWNANLAYVYFDELGFDRAGMEVFIAAWNAAVAARGLAPKPVAINFTADQIRNGNGHQAASLALVGFEAYLDPSLQNDPAQLTGLVEDLKARIGNRPMFGIVMGYDRNGAWTNPVSLVTIQTLAYLSASNDPRVQGLLVFSYGRKGGTRQLPSSIRGEHLKIWEAIS